MMFLWKLCKKTDDTQNDDKYVWILKLMKNSSDIKSSYNRLIRIWILYQSKNINEL
jgi:hypothetical protein